MPTRKSTNQQASLDTRLGLPWLPLSAFSQGYHLRYRDALEGVSSFWFAVGVNPFLEKIWWIFLFTTDDAQPLSSSHSSVNWRHGPSQAQKPTSSTLVRGLQHSSAPALWSCTQAGAADVTGPTDPTLGSVLCGISSPWQGTCLLLTAMSLPLSCTACCYGEPCSQPDGASGGPNTY